MSENLHIRYASADDVAAIAELAARTFSDAFAQANEPAEIEAYVNRSFSQSRLRAEIGDPTNVFLLAFSDLESEPVGYAKLRTSDVDPTVKGPKPIELERLYVDHEVIGQGVGSALLQFCLNEASRRGHETIWLGVWELNPRAIVFYRRWEFAVVGSHIFMLGAEKQTDLIMERSVVAVES